jgi:hypothetical protein
MDELEAIRKVMKGEQERSRAEQPGLPPPADLVDLLYRSIEASTAPPTADQKRLSQSVQQKLREQAQKLNRILSQELPALQSKLDQSGIRWTPGRPISLPPELPF